MRRCSVIWTAIRAALALSLGATVATAADCVSDDFEDVPYTACIIDPAQEELRLFHADTEGQVYGTFDRVNAALAEQGQEIGVAMNGGMYHDDRRPVGLYLENGTETMRLVTSEGPGNFGLLPNGVLCIAGNSVRVIETTVFVATTPDCTYASQSGPMLVIDGALHPRFRPDSTSRFIRNGVGVRSDGVVVMAISDAPITFHRFARLMRDALETPDALYIDGNVSRMYAPSLNRHDIGLPMGPILATVVPTD